MSLNVPSRRVLVAASTGIIRLPPSTTALCAAVSCRSSLVFQSSSSFPTTQRRTISWSSLLGRGKSKSKSKSDASPEAAAPWSNDLGSAQSRKALTERLSGSRLLQNSIFADELNKVESPEADGGGGGGGTDKRPDKLQTAMGGSLMHEHMARAVDPDPRSRVRWQRKKVIDRVQRGLDPEGRETKAEVLARTERVLTTKSSALPTSVKKLMHLARQVSGKTVEDALVQMRFSKKKMAKEVRWQLEHARDAAIVERGMGLGKVNGEVTGESKDIQIQTKDGKWMTIQDPTQLYVEQAWVGRGQWRHARVNYMGRGRRSIMWSPTTYLTLVVKEEKTRIRQHKEREAKQAKKAPWVHLPNRPVTAQRPYYSW